MKTSPVVKIDPEIMNGTPCFAGTRVPVRTLIDYLEAGDSLDEFLEDFPTVTREQAIALLEEASELLIAHAECAFCSTNVCLRVCGWICPAMKF